MKSEIPLVCYQSRLKGAPLHLLLLLADQRAVSFLFFGVNSSSLFFFFSFVKKEHIHIYLHTNII